MVISLCWKVGSSNSGLTGMLEVANGYRESEKVGFAHICSGYDLYVCPRSDKIITILAKHGFFKGIMAVEEDKDSMIGCVIWRRSHKSSNTGPKASDGTKNSSEKLLLSDEPSAVEVKCPLAESTPCSRESEGASSKILAAGTNNMRTESVSIQSSKSLSNTSSSKGNIIKRNCTNSIMPTSEEPTKIPLNVPPPLVLQAKEAPHCPDDDDDLPEFDFSDACGVRVKNLVSNLPSPLNRQLQVEKANMSGFAPPEARNMKLNDVLDPAPPTSSFGAESLNARERFSMPANYGNYASENRPDSITAIANQSLQRKSSWNDCNGDDDDDDMAEWRPPEFEQINQLHPSIPNKVPFDVMNGAPRPMYSPLPRRPLSPSKSLDYLPQHQRGILGPYPSIPESPERPDESPPPGFARLSRRPPALHERSRSSRHQTSRPEIKPRRSGPHGNRRSSKGR
ncbi:hypothetical protein ACMD2_23974 [Ananas comosus]|uniref:Spen paralogue and orthologue SPOC C-terminal domain-containing protein n=1 Tax=Ananas comosus TaxID=4615 RepID=A0A199UDQ1_ANACO|nr:hypothetical protein ACMD2_23974 [Ananas comosus]